MSLLVVGLTIPMVGPTRVPVFSADVLGPGFPAWPVCLWGPLPFLRLSFFMLGLGDLDFVRQESKLGDQL